MGLRGATPQRNEKTDAPNTWRTEEKEKDAGETRGEKSL